eukprot:scaffold154_cov373-Prasinococcus_capsulatus_cf.AAC.13
MRTGVIAAARSLETQRTTGLMITASHNPPRDNGVKISDPDGGMLSVEWERYCNNIAAATDADAVVDVTQALFDEKNIAHGVKRKREVPAVFVARDTRSSGPALRDAAVKGVEALGVDVKDFGILTTPQLHFLVRQANSGEEFSEHYYFQTLVRGYREVMAAAPSPDGAVPRKPLVVDAANGVGAMKVKLLQDALDDALEFDIRNDGSTGELNTLVGADFVEKERKPPHGFDCEDLLGRRCVSLDGDADRLVFFYFEQEHGDSPPVMRLLDGNKIAALAASFINAKLALLKRFGLVGDSTIGVVQTAYANGASTRFLRNEGLEVRFAKTGVKHLHVVANEYDVGVYFEANGHGTVLFKEEFVAALRKASVGGAMEAEARDVVNGMLALVKMINQSVGDALSGILLVEAILALKGWGIRDWDGQYENIPSKQLKVRRGVGKAWHDTSNRQGSSLE